MGAPVQKASRCAQWVRHGEGTGQEEEEERRHVSFVGDAEGRGESCIRAEAESSSSFFPDPHPLLFPPSPLIYLTQLGQFRPPQAADTTMYRITWNEQRNQVGTKLNFIVHTSTSGSNALWKLQGPFFIHSRTNNVGYHRSPAFTTLTRDTSTMTTVSLRFFIHMARARLRLVVLNVTDYTQYKETWDAGDGRLLKFNLNLSFCHMPL